MFLSKTTFGAYLHYRMVSTAPKKSIATGMPYGFKNPYPSTKPATVTRQPTKSTDFHQNYLCDFHPWPQTRNCCSIRRMQKIRHLMS
jgi:hypothetical protein